MVHNFVKIVHYFVEKSPSLWLQQVVSVIDYLHFYANLLYLQLQVLRLSHSTIGQLSIGHIVNLASTDVQRFDLVRDTRATSVYILRIAPQGFEFLHMWWVFVVSIPVMAYLLWRELGPSCLIGIGLILIQPPLQYALARLHTRLWYVCLFGRSLCPSYLYKGLCDNPYKCRILKPNMSVCYCINSCKLWQASCNIQSNCSKIMQSHTL